jgi:hypothetical protein
MKKKMCFFCFIFIVSLVPIISDSKGQDLLQDWQVINTVDIDTDTGKNKTVYCTNGKNNLIVVIKDIKYLLLSSVKHDDIELGEKRFGRIFVATKKNENSIYFGPVDSDPYSIYLWNKKIKEYQRFVYSSQSPEWIVYYNEWEKKVTCPTGWEELKKIEITNTNTVLLCSDGISYMLLYAIKTREKWNYWIIYTCKNIRPMDIKYRSNIIMIYADGKLIKEQSINQYIQR